MTAPQPKGLTGTVAVPVTFYVRVEAQHKVTTLEEMKSRAQIRLAIDAGGEQPLSKLGYPFSLRVPQLRTVTSNSTHPRSRQRKRSKQCPKPMTNI